MRTRRENKLNGRRALLALALLLMVPAGWAGCSRAEPSTPTTETQLVVFAASSLKDAFTALSADFRRAHPTAEVTFNFAGSQELRAQIEHGAQADIFASADLRHMEELSRAKRVGAPTLFARNEPVLVVATESAASIHGLADLPTATRIVLGAEDVPIGRYSSQILDRASAKWGPDFRARVESKVVSRELNVRQVLAKVSLGEAEAGIVYRSDVATGKSAVTSLSIPPEINVIATYPIAIVSGAPHPTLARAWVDLLLSDKGHLALETAGFLSPAIEATPQ